MKTEEKIEDAACDYMSACPKDSPTFDYIRIDSFTAGANWALASQWNESTKELPEDNQQVIGRYFFGCEDHNCHDDKIVYSQNNGENWFTDFGGIAFDIGKPDMWMPIPSLGEKLK